MTVPVETSLEQKFMAPDHAPNHHERNSENDAEAHLPSSAPSPLGEVVRLSHGVTLCECADAIHELTVSAPDAAVSFAVADLEDLWEAAEKLSDRSFEIRRYSVRGQAGSAAYWLVELASVPREEIASRNLDTISAEDAFSAAIESADLRGSYSDHGIGSYEYWGARGVHHDWRHELEDSSGTVSIDWLDSSFPALPESSRTTHEEFVVTKSSYSSRHDETFEDGFEVEIELVGTLERARIEPVVVNGEPAWKVSASFTWESS